MSQAAGRIIRQALVDPTVTRSTILAGVGVAIVPQKISRHLAVANKKSIRPFRTIPLTPEHRQLHLQWCQARSMWNVKYWQKGVFSDESRFVLGTNDNRVRGWRHPGEWYNSPTLPAQLMQLSGGDIAYYSRSTLIVMRGNLTGQRNVNDILHSSKSSSRLPTPLSDFSMDGPLPDLFPVEHVWDPLKRQMPPCHYVHDLEFHDGIDELLVDDALSDNDIINLTLDLTVDGVVGLEGDNDEEENQLPSLEKLIQEDLQLCSKLENPFLINDPNSERAYKLQRELQNSPSGYRELYKKIKKSSSQSLITDYIVRKGRATQNENEVCENPWPLSQISIAERVSSDDEGNLELLRQPLSDSDND
ncbi:transposable element Tcb2 transposase [Trichonephila clavipes]|nr:transposable element Tcb2 transposase [Trichonephila clavipes]